MSKLFSSILFSFFLLLHTTAIAEEEAIPEETNVELQESEAPEETEPTEDNNEQEIQEEVEAEEELSEAEKEALAAEEAELREAGMGEEPVPEKKLTASPLRSVYPFIRWVILDFSKIKLSRISPWVYDDTLFHFSSLSDYDQSIMLIKILPYICTHQMKFKRTICLLRKIDIQSITPVITKSFVTYSHGD